VLFDAGFLWVLLGSTRRHAPFRAFLTIRSLTYLLSAFHAALGAGALIVWIKKRFKTTLILASGIMGLEIVFEVGTLGLLGLFAAKVSVWAGVAKTPAFAALETFGWIAVGLSLVLVGWLRWRGRWSVGARDLTVLGAIKLGQNVVHGLFVVGLLSCFFLPVGFWEGLGMAQILRSGRGVPLSIMGVGVDQVAFQTLIPLPDGDRLFACSLVYTASMVSARLLPGVISLPWGLRIWQDEIDDDPRKTGAYTAH